MVISVDGDFCNVQKISKSFRNIRHKLKLTEVFPVSPSIDIRDDYSKGLENWEEEEPETDVINSELPVNNATTVHPYVESNARILEQSDSITDHTDYITVVPDAEPTCPHISSDAAETCPVQTPDVGENSSASTESAHQEFESPPDDHQITMKLRSPSKRRPPKRFADYELR